MAYKIYDRENEEYFCDEPFATKEEARDFITTAYHYDFDEAAVGMSREEWEAQPLEKICEDAHLTIEEI